MGLSSAQCGGGCVVDSPFGSEAFCPSTARQACLRVCRTGVVNRVRQQTVGGQSAWRAGDQGCNRHGVTSLVRGLIRPPVRPCCDGAEGGQRAWSHARRDSPSTLIRRPNPGSKARHSPLPALLVRRPPCECGSMLPCHPVSTRTPSRLSAPRTDQPDTLRACRNPRKPLRNSSLCGTAKP